MSICSPRLAEATMFTTCIVGFPLIRMPLLLSCCMTFMTAFFACFSDLEPTQTIFPEPKMRFAVLGFLSLKTMPGNCSGLYSTAGKALTMEFRLRVWLRVTEATTFTMFTFICLGMVVVLEVYLD